MELFLELLRQRNVKPNFWCSEEYLRRAGCDLIIDGDGWMRVVDDNGVVLFPVLHAYDAAEKPKAGEGCWSDFPATYIAGCRPEFLDYEILYDPDEFKDLSGGRWKIFRKNSRKWMRDRDPDDIHYLRLSDLDPSNQTISQLENLLLQWLEGRDPDAEVHDEEILLDYVRNGDNRYVLYDRKRGIVGVNIYDSNHRYINYRYVITNGDPYLDEYMRLLFYTATPEVLESGLMVNDGGSLGSEGLYEFKKRLNPIRTRGVLGWRKYESK